MKTYVTQDGRITVDGRVCTCSYCGTRYDTFWQAERCVEQCCASQRLSCDHCGEPDLTPDMVWYGPDGYYYCQRCAADKKRRRK